MKKTPSDYNETDYTPLSLGGLERGD